MQRVARVSQRELSYLYTFRVVLCALGTLLFIFLNAAPLISQRVDGSQRGLLRQHRR